MGLIPNFLCDSLPLPSAISPVRHRQTEESFAAWRKDPKYLAAYDAIEEEFAHAAATAMRLRISSAKGMTR